MSGLPASSALTNIWSSPPGGPTTGPLPLGGGNTTGLPIVNNPNLPSGSMPNIGNLPPPIPQSPLTPFPAIRQPLGGTNSINSNNYGLPQNFPSYNPATMNLMPNQAQALQSQAQALQNQANHRRLMQLEDENTRRRNSTLTLQQVGTHLLQDQMYVQEQVLQYQFMLEQCLETLDHQNLILNGQAEELALLRAKLRTFESFMDTIKQSQENNQFGKSTFPDSNFPDSNSLCSRKLLKSLNAPPGSPFSPGGVARVTSSKFQPFNPRYRSPTNNRSTNQNEPRNTTSSNTNPTTTNRLSRPINNFKN